jgi:hypothetical protein
MNYEKPGRKSANAAAPEPTRAATKVSGQTSKGLAVAIALELAVGLAVALAVEDVVPDCCGVGSIYRIANAPLPR